MGKTKPREEDSIARGAREGVIYRRSDLTIYEGVFLYTRVGNYQGIMTMDGGGLLLYSKTAQRPSYPDILPVRWTMHRTKLPD